MAKKITQEYILKVVATGLKEVTREIQTLNTNLTGTNKSVDQTGKTFDSAGKKQDTYLRGTKGVAHATNNNTKSFSKMAQNLNGTLVPAYATVAANVFALSAAFGALKRAADLEILITSAETFAVQTGRSLVSLSREMQNISGNALTLKDSLESASIAASAGFDDTTIKNLTQVAKNASVALGRDLTDSLNRVFKGAIKAEPELLDELGIILRLDTAARNYAATLGKSANALTTFEKQQAVVNAVIEQGESKFGDFADVDINPYTQLAAAFHDISASLIAIINVPISPILSFLADNVTALTAVIILFSASILKRAFPALTNFAETMEIKLAKATERSSQALAKAEASSVSWARSMKGTTETSRKALETFSKGIYQVQEVVEKSGKVISKNFKTAFSFGTDTVQGATAYKKAIEGVLAAFKKGVKVSQGFENTTENVQFLTEELGETKAVLGGLDKQTISVQSKLQAFGSGLAQTFASAKGSVLAFTTVLAKSATAGALAGYTQGFTGVANSLKAVNAETKGLTKAFALITTGVAGIGGAFLRMIPILGQVVFAWSLLSSAFTFVKEFVLGKSLVDLTATLEDNEEALNTAAKSAVFYNTKLKGLPNTIDNIDKKATLLSNTLDNLSDKLDNTLKDISISGDFTAFDDFLDSLGFGNLDTFKVQLNEINETIQSFGFNKEANDIVKEFGNLLRLSGDSAHFAGERMVSLLKTLRDTQRGNLELNNVLKESLTALSKGFTQLNDGLPALNGVETGFSNLNTILSTMDSGNIQLVVSSIEKLSNFDLRELGLTNTADNIAAIKKPLDGYIKSLQKVKVRLKEIEKIRAAEIKASGRERGFLVDSDIKKTQSEFDLLTGLVTSYQGAIDGVNVKLASQSADIIKQLGIIRDKFERIIDAQRLIADIRSKNAISNLEQGKGLDIRLKLLKELTDAENSYISTITEQTRFSLSSVKASIADVKKQLETASITDQAGLEIQLKNTLNKQQQLNNKLLEHRNKIVANYVKQVKVVQSELSKTTRFAAAGLVVSENQAKVLQDELYATYLNIATAQGKNNIEATKFATEMTRAAIAVEDFNAFIQKTRIPSVSALIGEISSLDKRAEVLDIEAKYLRDTNKLLTERIDKEFILADIINNRQIEAIQTKLGEIKKDDPEGKSDIALKTQQTLEALQIKAIKLDKLREKTINKATKVKLKGLKDELNFSKSILKLGIIYSKAQIQDIKRERTLQKLRAAGFKDVNKEFKEVIKNQEKLDFSKNFNEGIADMISGMSDFNVIMTELNDNLDMLGEDQKAAAGMKALSDIAEQSGNNVSKAFADLGLLVDTYSDKLDEGSMSARDWSAFSMSALGAMSQLFEEGSSEAKALAIAQQALAITNAVAAISNAGSSGDPYTAPARIAHMIGLMSAVLGMAGLGLSGGTTGAGAGEAYKETISKQGLVGQRDLQSNSLLEAIDNLVSIDTELFSTNRELQLTLVNLNKTFSRVGASLFGEGGSFEAGNILDIFGISFGTGGGGNVLSSRTTTNELVDAGIQLSSSISLVGNELVSSLNDASLFLIESVTVTKSRAFGLSKSTSTTLRTTFTDISEDLQKQLTTALSKIGSVVTGLFANFTSIIDLNLITLFEGLGTVAFNNLKISLTGKSAEEQSESIAAFVSLMSTTLIEKLVPTIAVFSQAGEELIDTLIRITENIWKLEAIFNTLGASLSSYIDTASLSAININDIFNQAFGGVGIDTSILDQLGVTYGEMVSFMEKALFDTGTIVGSIQYEIEKTRFEFFDEATIKKNIASAIEAMKIAVVAAWEESFLANFKDFDEFGEIFESFSNALYTESELTKLALLNAENTVGSGFDILRSTLTSLGETELLDVLGSVNTEAALKSVYELGNEIGSFSARFDTSTGEIDTSGADLLAIIIKLGAALANQQDASEALIDALDNLNLQYERQIALFGLVGKELELLELSFSFEDAIIEAKETGTNLALVETYYGLQRLEIIRTYNQDIVDALDASMSEVTDSIISILSATNFWDEVAYQSIRVTKIVNKLSASFASFGSSIDFTVFNNISDTTDFLTVLEGFIDVTVGSANNIEDQINLVTELREAVIARYDAEVAAAEELQSSIIDSIASLKELSKEIGDFLDDLFVGDLSPLTNAQKLAEAQSQFDENIQNVLSKDTELAEGAREALLNSASTLLEVASTFWAVGPEYQAIFNDVVGALEALDQSLIEDIALSEETLAINNLSDNFTELQLQTLNQLQTLDEILIALEAQNIINLSNELANYAPEINNNLTAILTKLEQVNNDSWNPILIEMRSLNNIMSGMGSFAKGSEEISYDQVAMIHKGETILTADTSKAIRSGESIYGVSDALPTTNGDSSDVVDAIRILTQVVASGNEDMLDKNEELRLATKNISTNIGFSKAASTKGIV